MAFEIVCCMSSHDSSTYHHITPIARHPLVSRVWIVRPRKSQYGEIPKSEYVLTPSRFKPWRFVQMARACLRLGHRNEVRAFVSFNPIPYGLIALLAAQWHKKPIHLGFFGSDWNRYTKGRWGRWLLPVFRSAAFVTAPGESMRQEMLERGFSAEQVAVLPHTVDLERYPVADPAAARYTCVFVGELIHLKRVDLILQAIAEVRKEHPETRLCIVGDGPLTATLQNLAVQLGIAEAVDFVGWVSYVQPYLADSRIVLIASENEGFPHALVEGMCCGLVPVSTPVGKITDVIVDGENGLLFPKNDAAALAACIQRLIDEPELYERLRAKVLELRQSFSYESTTAVWHRWLTNLADSVTELRRSVSLHY